MSARHPRPEHDGRPLAEAREKLRPPAARDRHWAGLGAAAFLALCAIAFAAAAVLAPPLNTTPAAKLGVK